MNTNIPAGGARPHIGLDSTIVFDSREGHIVESVALSEKQECVKHEVKRPPERVALLLASMNPTVIEPILPGFVKLANEAASYIREAIEAGVWPGSKAGT